MRWLNMFLLKKSSTKEKFNMAVTIGKLDKPKYRKPLLKLLKDTNKENQYAAAYALGLMKDESAFEPLIQMLNNPGIPIPTDLILPATTVLARSVNIEDTSMLEALFRALKNDPAKRYEAVIVLCGKNTQAVLEQFAHLSVHDSYHEIRKTAYRYLKEQKALHLFTKEIENADLDTKIIAHQANRIELDKTDIEELAGRLEHKDPRMRKHAADYLQKLEWLPPNKSEEAKLILAQQEWNKAQEFGSVSIAPLIKAVCSKIDYELIGNEGAWSGDLTMSKSYSRKDELDPMEKSVRKSAANTLVNMGNKAAVEAFVSILDDTDHHIQTLAISSLGKIGDLSAVKPIASGLEHWNKTLTNSAAIALGNIGGKEAVGVLIKLLKHESHHVRLSAIKALSKLKDETAVNSLCTVLLDGMSEAEENIVEAAKALGNIGSKRSVEALSKAISDEWYPAFKESVTALVTIGGLEAKASLENTHETRKVRNSKSGRQKYGEELIFLLKQYYRGWDDEAFDWIFDVYLNPKHRGLDLNLKKWSDTIENILISIADVRGLDTLLERINAFSEKISDLKITAGILEKNAKNADTEKLKKCLKIPRREDVRYRIDREYEEYYPYGLYTGKILGFARRELNRRGLVT